MTLKLIGRKFIGFERALSQQAQAFEQASGTKVSLEFLEVEELYELMVAKKGCINLNYDLMLLVTDWYPTLISQQALRRLNPFLVANPPVDWPNGWTESVLSLQRDNLGDIYGLPYHDGPEMLIYRKDLFESKKEQQRFLAQYGRPLKPPKTWSEFLQIARFFSRPKENLYGTIIAAFPDAHNIIYDFFLQLWTRRGEVLDSKGQPAFHSPIGIEALSFLRDLMHKHQATPPDCDQVDSVKSGARFAEGEIAMMVNWMGFAAFADAHESSKVRGKIGCGLVPAGDKPNDTGCSLNIYWCLSIPAGSQYPQDAYRFLKWCASQEMDRLTSESGAIGVRKSSWKEFAQRGVAGYSALEELHAHARHLPRLPYFGKMSEILNKHLDRALNKGGDVKAELQRAAERCLKIENRA